MRRLLPLLLWLCLPIAALAAPTALHIVDLRWIAGEPELETWLGSLQGAWNRQGGESVIFLVRNEGDQARATALTHTYRLDVERFTPGALLVRVKDSLTGQALYDPAHPWTRNVALTAAAALPGMVIATERDLGLPTVLDARARWDNRLDACAWTVAEYGNLLATGGLVLAPEGGHLLADAIVSRKCLAVDLAPNDAREAAVLRNLLDRMPAGLSLLGSPDDRCGAPEMAFSALTELLRGGARPWVPARDIANLSAFARFPAVRPLLQGRDEREPEDGRKSLTLIYDGGNPLIDGSQSLDYAVTTLATLLDDPALRELPVGVQAPAALLTYAPALYQEFIARQRVTAAELIASPNGSGWALPMLMAAPAEFLDASAALARAGDLAGAALFDVGEQARYRQTLDGMAKRGWRGALVRPVPIELLPDQHRRDDLTAPGFVALVGMGRAASADELRAALAALKNPFNVLFLDPAGLPPSTLQLLLPEVEQACTLLTPSQTFRAVEEYAAVMPWMQEQLQQQPKRAPKRNPPTLAVSRPACAVAPSAGAALPITVRITGPSPILVARLIYQAPDGRRGAADLRDAGNGAWSAALPPMLTGGALSIRARVVEQHGFGITLSAPLTLEIPRIDTDGDGLDDTLEEYLGSAPARQDSDGDGLPDGMDAHPARLDRDIIAYYAPVVPPADASMLVDGGVSTADAEGRLIPAGGSIVYRLPLADLPAVRATLRLVTVGTGKVALNTAAARALEVLSGRPAFTDVPLSAAGNLGKELTVRLTAGDAPLRLYSLSLITNPEGPYLLPARLTPAFPPAGVPIPFEVVAYSPRGITAARLRYAPQGGALATLALTPVEGSANTLFRAEIPAQRHDTRLIYAIEAEDAAGNVAVSPFTVAPIGLTRRHTVALVGGRDLRGGWQPAALWGDFGRELTRGAAQDTHLFAARPGTYTAWILAQPRVRGLGVTVEYRDDLQRNRRVLLSGAVPAAAADGWFRLGTFKVDRSVRLHVTVTPAGETGHVAYGMVVLTQDETLTPPLAHAGLDWYNSLAIRGLSEGQVVSGRVNVQVLATGNLGGIEVTATRGGDLRAPTRTIPLLRQADGSYLFDTRDLLSGVYIIKAVGYRLTREEGIGKQQLVSVSLRVTVQGK